MAPIIEINGMTKRFSSNIAVCNLNFAVEEGEVFGLLGPNIAGKTMTIRVLACLISPSDDSATVSGYKILKNPLAMVVSTVLAISFLKKDCWGSAQNMLTTVTVSLQQFPFFSLWRYVEFE